LEYKVKDLQKLLNANFLENFDEVGENLYTYQYQIEEYKYHLLYFNNPNHANKSQQEKLKVIIDNYEVTLNRKGNVRTRSTNALTREVSTWIFIANLELKNWFKTLIEGDFKIYEWDTHPTMSAPEPETDDEDGYVERNEFGDEFVGGCATCGDDINSAQTDSNGNCKNCR
jgi:hypothetical protein